MRFYQYVKSITESLKKKCFPDTKIVNSDGSLRVVYHGTNQQFNRFSLKNSTQGIIWFSTDKEKILRGESGAAGNNRIISMYVDIKNPAGWEEYEKLMLFQIKSEGFDGVILRDEGTEDFDGFVFSPKQIKIIK